jgi:hypothetical protein
MNADDELDEMWKKAALVYFKVQINTMKKFRQHSWSLI